MGLSLVITVSSLSLVTLHHAGSVGVCPWLSSCILFLNSLLVLQQPRPVRLMRRSGQIKLAQVMTVISWCTYPVVYLFPMLGINASDAVVAIQLGYCVSDIISKCGVGLVIYQISYGKSCKDGLLA